LLKGVEVPYNGKSDTVFGYFVDPTGDEGKWGFEARQKFEQWYGYFKNLEAYDIGYRLVLAEEAITYLENNQNFTLQKAAEALRDVGVYASLKKLGGKPRNFTEAEKKVLIRASKGYIPKYQSRFGKNITFTARQRDQLRSFLGLYDIYKGFPIVESVDGTGEPNANFTGASPGDTLTEIFQPRLKPGQITKWTQGDLVANGISPNIRFMGPKDVNTAFKKFFHRKQTEYLIIAVLENDRTIDYAYVHTIYKADTVAKNLVIDSDMVDELEYRSVIVIHNHPTGYTKGGRFDAENWIDDPDFMTYPIRQLVPSPDDIFTSRAIAKYIKKAECYLIGPDGCVRFFPIHKAAFHSDTLTVKNRSALYDILKNMFRSMGVAESVDGTGGNALRESYDTALLESLTRKDLFQLFYVLQYIYTTYKLKYRMGSAMPDSDYVLFSKVSGELEEVTEKLYEELRKIFLSWMYWHMTDARRLGAAYDRHIIGLERLGLTIDIDRGDGYAIYKAPSGVKRIKVKSRKYNEEMFTEVFEEVYGDLSEKDLLSSWFFKDFKKIFKFIGKAVEVAERVREAYLKYFYKKNIRGMKLGDRIALLSVLIGIRHGHGRMADSEPRDGITTDFLDHLSSMGSRLPEGEDIQTLTHIYNNWSSY